MQMHISGLMEIGHLIVHKVFVELVRLSSAAELSCNLCGK